MPLSLNVGEFKTVAANPQDQNNNPIAAFNVAYSVDQPLATLTPNGLECGVTGAAGGTCNFTVSGTGQNLPPDPITNPVVTTIVSLFVVAPPVPVLDHFNPVFK